MNTKANGSKSKTTTKSGDQGTPRGRRSSGPYNKSAAEFKIIPRSEAIGSADFGHKRRKWRTLVESLRPDTGALVDLNGANKMTVRQSIRGEAKRQKLAVTILNGKEAGKLVVTLAE